MSFIMIMIMMMMMMMMHTSRQTYGLWERETSKVDREFLRKKINGDRGVEYLVLDEGHTVKNTSSQR
jgi:hypothetical protein